MASSVSFCCFCFWWVQSLYFWLPQCSILRCWISFFFFFLSLISSFCPWSPFTARAPRSMVNLGEPIRDFEPAFVLPGRAPQIKHHISMRLDVMNALRARFTVCFSSSHVCNECPSSEIYAVLFRRMSVMNVLRTRFTLCFSSSHACVILRAGTSTSVFRKHVLRVSFPSICLSLAILQGSRVSVVFCLSSALRSVWLG